MNNDHQLAAARAATGSTRRGTPAIAAGLLAFALVAPFAPASHAGSPGDVLESVSVDELKRVYLSCSRAAINGRLDGAGIMQCSVVYEVLKQRGFDGDFARMLAWSRAHPSALNTER